MEAHKDSHISNSEMAVEDNLECTAPQTFFIRCLQKVTNGSLDEGSFFKLFLDGFVGSHHFTLPCASGDLIITTQCGLDKSSNLLHSGGTVATRQCVFGRLAHFLPLFPPPLFHSTISNF